MKLSIYSLQYNILVEKLLTSTITIHDGGGHYLARSPFSIYTTGCFTATETTSTPANILTTRNNLPVLLQLLARIENTCF